MKKILTILLFAVSLGSFAQVTIEDSVRVSTECVDDFTPVIQFPRDEPTTGIFRNNSITYCNPASYLVMIGEDGPFINDNTLDSLVAYGNYFKYTGTNYTGVMHGLMAGYNINQHFRWNYFDGVGYCIVYKAGGSTDHDGMTNTSGGTYYNIIKNTMRLGMKGVSGTRVYNNTFYNSWTEREDYPFIKITPNNDEPENTPLPPAQGTIIKNNIFYSTNAGQKFYEIEDTATSFVDLVSDYNVFYVPGGSASDIKFQLNGGTWIDFTAWQALGFDEHSIIIDPNFVDTVNFAPSARLDYGTTLSAPYDEGLAVDAEWNHGVTPATATQNGDWQVGAVLWETSPTAKYVATDGNDSNEGTISSPWLTWNKAFTTAAAGDTVYFRGGTYNTTVTNGSGLSITNSGTRANPITFLGYPGETAILDCINSVTDDLYNFGIRVIGKSNLIFRNLTVKNVLQKGVTNDTVICYGIKFEQCDSIILDRVNVHHTGGKGHKAEESDKIHYINCDSYANSDSLGVFPGGWATGFGIANSDNDTCEVYYRGCRAWNNSDQGFSTGGQRGLTVYDTCWVWNSGDLLDGEGFGFKLGYNSTAASSMLNVVMRNCISTGNRYGGVTTNDQGYYEQGMQIYNNFFFNNRGWTHPIDGIVGGYGVFILNPSNDDGDRIFKNNVTFYNRLGDYVINSYGGDYNSWEEGTGVTVDSTDFVSLDATQLAGDRQSDGSLPVITFGTLAEGSDLINAGTYVGIDTVGAGADLGWAEYGATSEPPVTYNPPTVTTTSASSVWIWGATTGGNVTSDGGATVTERGICWSTSANPTVSGDHTSSGTGTGTFTITLTDLTSNTTYHIRAYATNSEGTSYGADVSFTTPEYSGLGNGGVTIYSSDGKVIVVQ